MAAGADRAAPRFSGKRQLEMDVASLRIVLDRITLDLAEAGQVVGGVVVVAGGVVLRP